MTDKNIAGIGKNIAGKKNVVLPIAAVLLLLFIITWMAGIFDEKVAPGLSEIEPILTAKPETVKNRDMLVLEAVPASVEAKQATLISSRIMARILNVHVRAGDTVTEGQLLVQLEKTDLQARAKQSAEQIRAVAARLKEAEQNLTRMTQLRKQRLIAIADLDKARANHNSLQAELASAQQAKEEAETAVSFAEIRSPINGRVVDRFAEPGDTTAPGVKLLSVYNPLSLRVEAHVREKLALSLSINQELTVEIPSLQTSINAEVEELVPAAEPGSRSFLVKVRIPYQQQLLPGMYARLLLPVGEKQQLLVPESKIAKVGQLNVVWVLEGGQPVRRFVRTGRTIDGHVEILAGLNANEEILSVQ